MILNLLLLFIFSLFLLKYFFSIIINFRLFKDAFFHISIILIISWYVHYLFHCHFIFFISLNFICPFFILVILIISYFVKRISRFIWQVPHFAKKQLLIFPQFLQFLPSNFYFINLKMTLCVLKNRE